MLTVFKLFMAVVPTIHMITMRDMGVTVTQVAETLNMLLSHKNLWGVKMLWKIWESSCVNSFLVINQNSVVAEKRKLKISGLN